MPRRGRLIAFACAFVLFLAGASVAGARPRPSLVAPVLEGAPVGAPVAAGFLGFSMEFYTVHEYAGSDPDAVNPVLVQLIRNLAPGQTPVLRIGGDSTDQSWWPVPGVLPPRGIDYPLTQGWVRTAAALARALDAKLIVGVNLMLNRPALTAVEARALLAGLGGSLAAFEIGNEGDLYGTLPWYLTVRGTTVYGRPRSYGVARFLKDVSGVRGALPAAPIAGPAFANLPWMAAGLSPFMAATGRLSMVTVHRYPLRGCNVPTSSPSYPTVANLLSDYAQTNIALGVAPYVAEAHARGLPFRVDEINSVACAGTHGVSDTFASALWMLDTLFELASVGVDGVNVHTLAGARYAPFSFTQTAAGWQAAVHPEYYGMLMFAQAAPAGSRLLPITGVPDGPVKVWATLAPDGTERVVLINEDVTNGQPVVLQAPGSSAAVEELTAPSAVAATGVTLGGQSFGDATTTGVLPAPAPTGTVYPVLGLYSLTLPPASATLLTLR
ncbi:MAG TPA: glycosyl hydrolase family 79 C-terminal domain-containing protein [Solirubrobacteraceae bacterium]|nr:glycosyl hydrolase family 79 C-terminal domain-containing protein [Solirubrobacteraceae bacterium]